MTWGEKLQAIRSLDSEVLLRMHVSGDWGDLEELDRQQNDEALKRGGRIFSAYHTSEGTKVWVITEADHSYTTALLPEDY